MKVIVTKEKVVITEFTPVNESETMVNKCEFTLPTNFKDLTVTAAFNNIPVPLINGCCYIPSLKKGTATLGVYAYKQGEKGVELMYSPKPTTFFVCEGSYSEDLGVEKLPEISEYEEYCNQVKGFSVLKSDLVNTFGEKAEPVRERAYSVKAVNDFYEKIKKEFPQSSNTSDAVDKLAETEQCAVLDDCLIYPHKVKVLVNAIFSDEGKPIEFKSLGKNIFTFKSRSVLSFAEGEDLMSLLGIENIFLGVNDFTKTNDSMVQINSIDKTKDTLTVTFNDLNYGIGFDFPVKGDSYYSVTTTDFSNLKTIKCTFFDIWGTVLETIDLGSRYFFKTNPDAAYAVITVYGNKANVPIELKNFQLEFGIDATPYEPYREIDKTIIKNCNDGEIKSGYPTTYIICNEPMAYLTCYYKMSINKALKEIKDAIVSLGGNI